MAYGMKILSRDPPRRFKVSQNPPVEISDFGDIHLNPDEQVTFVTENGKRHDFVRKDWGFYATPSINGRLKREGFKTAMVKNEAGQIYIMVVDPDHMVGFEKYCHDHDQKVIRWLDVYPE